MNGITLERDHHNGHWNDKEGDFDHCVPVLVHAESEDEAEAIRDAVAVIFDDGDLDAAAIAALGEDDLDELIHGLVHESLLRGKEVEA